MRRRVKAVNIFVVLLFVQFSAVVSSSEEKCRENERKALTLEIENGELRTEVARLKKENLDLREANDKFLNEQTNCSALVDETAYISNSLKTIEHNMQPLENYLKSEMNVTEPKKEFKVEKVENIKYGIKKIHASNGCDDTVGVIEMKLPHSYLEPFPVACDGDGWIVILRRMDGSVDFNRTWQDYKMGFGNPTGEVFLGLEKVHQLTTFENYELMITLQDFENKEKYAIYDGFRIGSETDKYKFEVSDYKGTLEDSFKQYNSNKFSTYDNDNDIESVNNCALKRHGGWWWAFCIWSSSKLTGLYIPGGKDDNTDGINWQSWKHYYSFKAAKMSIRKRNH